MLNFSAYCTWEIEKLTKGIKTTSISFWQTQTHMALVPSVVQSEGKSITLQGVFTISLVSQHSCGTALCDWWNVNLVYFNTVLG